MTRSICLLPLIAAACAPAAEMSPEPAFAENVIDVPGFADFLQVDGDTVWTTNDGRVEQWSKTEKLASVAIPRPCGTMAMESGSLWVGNCDGCELYRIGPETAQVLATIPAGIGRSGEQNEVAPGTTFLAFGFDALWAVSGTGGTLQRVDPATNAVTDTIQLGDTPGFLVAGEGAVWVQEQGDGTVARIDPETREVAGRTLVGDNLKWGDIDTGDGKVWLRTTDDQTFVVIDAATAEILGRVGRPEGSGALRYTPDGIWTSAHDVHSLTWWTSEAR